MSPAQAAEGGATQDPARPFFKALFGALEASLSGDSSIHQMKSTIGPTGSAVSCVVLGGLAEHESIRKHSGAISASKADALVTRAEANMRQRVRDIKAKKESIASRQSHLDTMLGSKEALVDLDDGVFEGRLVEGQDQFNRQIRSILFELWTEIEKSTRVIKHHFSRLNRAELRRQYVRNTLFGTLLLRVAEDSSAAFTVTERTKKNEGDIKKDELLELIRKNLPSGDQVSIEIASSYNLAYKDAPPHPTTESGAHPQSPSKQPRKRRRARVVKGGLESLQSLRHMLYTGHIPMQSDADDGALPQYARQYPRGTRKLPLLKSSLLLTYQSVSWLDSLFQQPVDTNIYYCVEEHAVCRHADSASLGDRSSEPAEEGGESRPGTATGPESTKQLLRNSLTTRAFDGCAVLGREVINVKSKTKTKQLDTLVVDGQPCDGSDVPDGLRLHFAPATVGHLIETNAFRRTYGTTVLDDRERAILRGKYAHQLKTLTDASAVGLQSLYIAVRDAPAEENSNPLDGCTMMSMSIDHMIELINTYIVRSENCDVGLSLLADEQSLNYCVVGTSIGSGPFFPEVVVQFHTSQMDTPAPALPSITTPNSPPPHFASSEVFSPSREKERLERERLEREREKEQQAAANPVETRFCLFGGCMNGVDRPEGPTSELVDGVPAFYFCRYHLAMARTVKPDIMSSVLRYPIPGRKAVSADPSKRRLAALAAAVKDISNDREPDWKAFVDQTNTLQQLTKNKWKQVITTAVLEVIGCSSLRVKRDVALSAVPDDKKEDRRNRQIGLFPHMVRDSAAELHASAIEARDDQAFLEKTALLESRVSAELKRLLQERSIAHEDVAPLFGKSKDDMTLDESLEHSARKMAVLTEIANAAEKGRGGAHGQPEGKIARVRQDAFEQTINNHVMRGGRPLVPTGNPNPKANGHAQGSGSEASTKPKKEAGGNHRVLQSARESGGKGKFVSPYQNGGRMQAPRAHTQHRNGGAIQAPPKEIRHTLSAGHQDEGARVTRRDNDAGKRPRRGNSLPRSKS